MLSTGDKSACLVEVVPASSWSLGKKAKVEASGSGVLINNSTGHVVTHASILAPLLSANKQMLNRLDKQAYLIDRHLKSVQAKVTLSGSAALSHKVDGRHLIKQGFSLSQYFTAMFNVNTQPSDCCHKVVQGNVQLVWKAHNLGKTLEKLFPKSDGWTFQDNSQKDADESKATSQEPEIDPVIVSMLMPYFVLVKLENWIAEKSYNVGIHKESLQQGDECYVIGTPFGNLSPSVFLNSYSKGVVCNTAGAKNELILTDARCIPGTEGAPLFTKVQPHSFELLGLVIAPLCWRSNEWMGLSLACSLPEVLSSLADVPKSRSVKLSLDLGSAVDLVHAVSADAEEVKGPLELRVPVVLIWNKGTWGTGIILDQEEGLIVTCSHVVLDRPSVQVGVDDPDRREWYRAKVLFATPAGQVWDVALLKMADYSSRARWPRVTPMAACTHEGQDVAVVGHSMFSREHQLRPSVTSGVVSKISTIDGVPVCIQSTCTVTAGASGGPLVAPSGHVIGIVACNAKDSASGASFPNINLSVPMVAVWNAVQMYLDTGGGSLEEVSRRNRTILFAAPPSSWRASNLAESNMADIRHAPVESRARGLVVLRYRKHVTIVTLQCSFCELKLLRETTGNYAEPTDF